MSLVAEAVLLENAALTREEFTPVWQRVRPSCTDRQPKCSRDLTPVDRWAKQVKKSM